MFVSYNKGTLLMESLLINFTEIIPREFQDNFKKFNSCENL